MLARVTVATVAAAAALGAAANAQAPAIEHFPLPDALSVGVVQGQDRLIVATATHGGGLTVSTQGFDGSGAQILAQLPVPAGRKGFSIAAVAATPTTWVLGWRVVHTFVGDEDAYSFIQSEQVVTGAMSGGAAKVLSHCTAPKQIINDLGEEGVKNDLTVAADGARIAWGGALCPGMFGMYTRTPAAGLKHISGAGSAPLLAGRYMAYTRGSRAKSTLVLASAATGRVVASTNVDAYSGVSAALDSDGTLVALGGPSQKFWSLTVTTPHAATRTLARAAVNSTAAVLRGRVVYTATDGHLVTKALTAGAGPATRLASDLPATQRIVGFNAVLGLDAQRVISQDVTCAGSELTVTPLVAAPVTALLPAECPVQFVATDVQATASGTVPVTVSCALGCSAVRVLLIGAANEIVAAGDTSAPLGGTGTVSIELTAAIRQQLAKGPVTLGLIADNQGRDGAQHQYHGSLSIHP